MRSMLLTFMFTAIATLTPDVAEAGCRCGRSYISETYTCHKCPCECPKCDNRDCRMPEMLQPVLDGTDVEAAYCRSAQPR